jgi:two-component system, OmpR family, sensor histidine kinase SenX3
MRRGLQRRLEAVVGRLEPDGYEPGPGGVETTLKELEAASAAVADRVSSAGLVNALLGSALEHVEHAVVICDPDGRELYRNARAGGREGARPADALAEQAVADALAEARGGGCPERTLELSAPYRRTLVIRAFPLYWSSISEADEPPGPRAGREPRANGHGARAKASQDETAESAWGRIGAVAIVEDVSERRRLEDVRRDFVANVSHELKTPVGALRLLAETLDGEEDPDVITRLLARVTEEAGRLGRIIEELLDLSRIEVNESPGHELIGVQRIVAEATRPVQSTARDRGVELAVGPVPPGVAVPGDRRDLVSAVTNLVDNAVKYSEAGGQVRVTVTAAGGWVDIDVADNGIGIPSRDLERIFERFYRVDRARSRSTGGTGLGLSIVRHIAVNHGGTVAVRSVEGEGSTFTLRLPMEGGPPASDRRSHRPSATSHRGLVRG